MSFYSDKSTEEYSLIPVGQYTAELFNVKPGDRDGTPTLSFQYKLENNRSVFQNFSFNERGMKWISWQLGVLGLNKKAQDLAKGDDTPSVAQKAYLEASSALINSIVTLEITHNIYEGKTREVTKLVSCDLKDTESSLPTIDDEERLPF